MLVKESLTLLDGTPAVPADSPHGCHFPGGYHSSYSHMTVGVILTNNTGEIALVARDPNQATEGGKLAIPGGYVEIGQRLRDAAEAEVREETGHAIVPGTLGRFALMDGPTSLPGRQMENDLNIVAIFTAQAGPKVQEHDHEVTSVLWVPPTELPLRERMAFGHFDIVGMWLRHQEQPFHDLPIVPSEMDARELFPADWPLDV